MVNNELDELLNKSHKDLSVEDFEGKKVPCIGFEGQKFDEMLNRVSGKPLSVDTNLNILQDGVGHVFVEMLMKILIFLNHLPKIQCLLLRLWNIQKKSL